MAMGDIVLRIVTKGADLAKKQLDGVGGSGSASGKKLAKFGQMAKVAGIAVGVALAKGLQKSVEAFMEFDDKMTQSLAIMNTTVEQNEAMEKAALELSRSTRISASESAEAYFFLASAGLDAEQSIQALPQVAKFAQAGMFDMATATDLATDAQSALGLTVKDAQQNLQNLTRVTDVLVKGNQLANASVQQFSEALTNKAGAALKVVNKDIEEGMAVLAAFADRGVKGAEAGDKLNQVLRDIPRATAKNSEEFEKLGLNMFDTNGNMKNVADIVEELDAVLGPMSDEMKAATLDQLGLNRGVADAVKILSGAGDQIREYEEALRSSGGATDEVANNQMNSLKAQTDLMRNGFQELGIAIGSIISGPLTSLVKKITGVAQGITDFITDTQELSKAMDENREAAEKQVGLYGTELPKAYSYYGTAIHETTEQQTDFRSATQRAIDSARELDRVQTNYATTEDIIAEALAKHNSEQERLNRNAEEYKEIQEEIAETQKEKALPALNTMFQAYKKIQDIQDNIIDLQNEERKALDKVVKEKDQLDKANESVVKAEEELAKQKEISKQVTLEEEIAILRQVEAIKRLEEQEEKTILTEKELELAKRKLEEITLASTSATADEERALNTLERAKKDVEDQTESLRKAQEQYREATEDLADATAKSTENLMEMAIAKAELDKAIEDVKSLGLLEDSIAQLVKNAGGDFDTLLAKMTKIMNFSGQSGFNISGSDTSSSSTGSQVFDTEGINLGSESGSTGSTRESARDQALRVARTSDTNVTLNVNGVLTTMEVPQMVAEVVKKAREQGLDFL